MFSPPISLVILQLLVLLGFAIPLSYMDLRYHRLPNQLTLALTLSELFVSVLFVFLDRDYREIFLFALLISSLIAVAAITLSLFAPKLIGMGDAKLLPVICFLCCGWGSLGLISAFIWITLLGGAFAIISIVVNKHSLRNQIPMGPVLLTAPLGPILLSPLLIAGIGG